MAGVDEETLVKIREDEDFIALKRFDYSVEEILKRYPEGVPDRLISQGLAVPEEQLQPWYEQVVAKLRAIMKVDVDLE